jgi:hypothetical protein
LTDALVSVLTRASFDIETFGGSHFLAYGLLFLDFLFGLTLGTTLLSFWLENVRHDIPQLLVGGTLWMFLTAVEQGHRPAFLSNFGVLRFLTHLGVQALTSGLVVLSGHALLVISAPLLYVTPVDYASSLPSALPVGIIGGVILFCARQTVTCVFPSALGHKAREKKETVGDTFFHHLRSVLTVTVAGAAWGAGISVIGRSLLHTSSYTVVNFKLAVLVGALGGALMGSFGIKPEVGGRGGLPVRSQIETTGSRTT